MVDAPRLDTVSRPSANRSWILAEYTAMSSGYSRIYAYVGTGSSLQQATWTDTLNGQILITSIGGQPLAAGTAYNVELAAMHVSEGMTGRSNRMSAAAYVPTTPTLSAAERTGANSALLTMSGLIPGHKCYIYRRTLPSGTFAQLTAFDITTAATTFSVNAAGGLSTYEYEVRQGQWGALSAASTARSVPAWWQSPVSPSITGAERNPETGAVTINFEGDPTARGPWLSTEVWRSYGADPFYKVATLAGSARSYTGAADPTRAVRIRLVVKSHAGDAQATSSSLAATLLVPNAPSSVTATYTGTNQGAVAWTRNPTGERPYTSSQRVGYAPWADDEGSEDWTWTSVSSGATSATIALPANGKWKIGVDAGNAAGRSEVGVASTPVVTTPAGPASLSAAWLDGDIIVTIPAYSTVGDRLVIETSTDGSAWFPAAELAVDATSWRHSEPTPALPHYYRAWVESDSPGTPNSATVTSAAVPALTKPAPPTVLPLESLDATDDMPVEIAHNSLDGSAKTAGELQHRVGDGAWTTIVLGGASTASTIPAGTYTNGQDLQRRARTMGGGGVWSDWSTPVTETLRARPTGVLTGPGATVEGQQITATWAASAQTQALVELLDAGGLVLESRPVGSAPRALAFAHVAQDQTDYSVRLRVRDAWQWSLPDEASTTVELDRPTKPVLSAAFVDETVSVTVSVVVDGDTVLVELYRDGHLADTAVPASLAATMEDLLPPLTKVVYTVRAYSAAGGWTDSDPVTVDAYSRDVIVSYGPGWTSRVRGGSVAGAGTGGARDVRLEADVAGGMVAYRSAHRQPITVSDTVQLLPATGASSVDEWLEALGHDGPVCYRKPGGRTVIGTPILQSWDDGTRYRAEVTFSVTEEAGVSA